MNQNCESQNRIQTLNFRVTCFDAEDNKWIEINYLPLHLFKRLIVLINDYERKALKRASSIGGMQSGAVAGSLSVAFGRSPASTRLTAASGSSLFDYTSIIECLHFKAVNSG